MRICRPWITVRGKRLYAHHYGKKAFCWDVDDDKSKPDKSDDTTSPDDDPDPDQIN